MHGNVWEWCLDHWHDSYADKPEELKQNGNIAWLSNDKDAYRLLRGGSWDNNPDECRSAYRQSRIPSHSNVNIGFRVVCRGLR